MNQPISISCQHSACKAYLPQGQLLIYVNEVPQWFYREQTVLSTRQAPGRLPMSMVAMLVLQCGSAKMPSRSSYGKLSRKPLAMSASVWREIT